MNPEQREASPRWLSYVDLACATAAGVVWYLFPQSGPWPLFLALLPWGLRLIWTGRPTRRTSLDLLLGFFVLTAGLGVWAAYDRSVAWRKFWLIVGAVFIFYALVNAESLGEMRSWLLASFGAGVALYFLVTHDWQAYQVKIEALSRLGRTLQAPLPDWPGHRMNPNVAASILAMMLPFAGLVTLQAWQQLRQTDPPQLRARWPRLVFAFLLLALTLFGLLMTVSRAAWLAVFVAFLLVVLWAIAVRLARSAGRSRATALAGMLGLGLVLLLGIGLIWPWLSAAVMPADKSISGRLELLQRSATLLGDYPLVGAGLGGFQMLYSTYALLLHVGYLPHSHNLFLDVALEQGLPGLLALAGMWLLFVWRAWRVPSPDGGRRAPGALAAAAVSLLIVLLHGLADDPLYSGRGVLLLFIPLAFGACLSVGRSPRRGRQLAFAWPVGLLVLLLIALLWREPLLSVSYSNLGAIHQSRTELSIYRWPEWPVQDDVRRQVNLDQPLLEFQRALAFNPRNGTAHRRLGMIDLAQSRYGSALQHLEATLAVEPHSQTTQQLLGEAYLANGQLEEGQALWSDVSNDLGQLDLRVAWYQYIGDPQRAAWMAQAIPDLP
jgi:putative inorganic carbon (HCO3(-)) transporter